MKRRDRLENQAERERVDAAFAAIADDPEYQQELLRIEREMSPGSDAAWRLLDESENSPDGHHG